MFNLDRGRHSHLALTMAADDYLEKICHVFILLYNPGGYPPTLGTSQDQTLGTETFRNIQALS